MVSFSIKCLKSNKHLYLVKGIEEARQAWYYIEVDALKEPLFKRQCIAENNVFDLKGYGKVLECGWGENPPADVAKRIEEEYN